MIKLRLNPFSQTEETFKVEGEKVLHDEVKNILIEKGFDEKYHSQFHVLYKGEEVDEDFQKKIKIDDESQVLIAPKIEGSDFGQVFKQIAIIAVTVAVTAALPGAGAFAAGSIGGALAVAGATIGATLLLNALIPPPDPGGGNLGGLGDGPESSQMYSLGGQSNRAKPFGVVPKVYGTFKMYPTVAGQPYTTVEVDYSTGKLVQVLYAIYDFGLGPLVVNDLRIGDTSIEEFDDVEYNFVDPNKPTVNEGPWDDQTQTEFEIYKGDVALSEDPYTLDKNQVGEDAGDIADYRVVRTGPLNPDSYQQELTVNLTFPRGIFSFSQSGARGGATVELDIEFAVEGTEDWRAYNDYAYVSTFKSTGGTASVINTRNITLPAFSEVSPYYEQISDTYSYPVYKFSNNSLRYHKVTVYPFGFKNETNIVYGVNEVFDGESLAIDGKFIGNVVSSTDLGGVYEITLDTLLIKDIPLFRREIGTRRNHATIFDNIIGSATNRLLAGTTVLKKGYVTANDQSQYYTAFVFNPRVPAQYKVRVTRYRTTYDYGSQKISNMSYLSTTTRFNRPTINTNKRHTFMELKIRATNQINGNLDNISGIVSSVIPIYDDVLETWSLGQTDNPAWIFCDLLTGEINKKAVTRDRLHMPTIVEWADYAEEIPVTPPGEGTFIFQRFSCNFIMDFSTTLKGLLDSVGGSCQASLNIVDGQYGVLIDRKQTIPIQVFTPRNYSNFSSTRTYAESTQGLKIKYNEPADAWKLSEKVIYADGYNETNLTEDLEDLKSFGVTNDEQAWRYGRYMLSQAALRQETITVTVDFEHLVCTRGDYVQFTQDSMKVGGRPARVKTVAGIQITIDDAIDTVVGPSYGYLFRGVAGITESTLTPVNSTTFDLDGAIPAVGDLIVIGEVDSIVFDCIIKAISPQDNLKATLTLVEKVDAIYDSLETGTIPDYDPQLTETSGVILDAPGEVVSLAVTENSYTVGDSQFDYFIKLGWQAPISGGITDQYEIYVDRGEGYDFWDTTKELTYNYVVDNFYLDTEHKFKVIAVSSSGQKLNLGEIGFVAATPERKATPPANVSELNINITNQVIQLDWVLLDAQEGVRDYVVRYNPTLEGNWFNSIPLAIVDRRTSSTSAQGRKGTYLIKAIDFEGNESADAAFAITSIPELFDLNVIDEVDEAPTWGGVKDRVEVSGGSLFLQKQNATEFYPEGYYYFQNPLDLGLNYTTRLQSLVEAGGFTEGDLMSSWVTLDAVPALTTSTIADWDVEAQVRVNDQINFISTWDPLSDVTAMSEGDIDDWSPYKTFIMGDFTAKLYQFRLKLVSNLPGVSPEVFSGLIRADMPDRIEDGDNITSLVGGSAITYDPPFKGPGTTPAIQITQDNASQGDYYLITSKTLDGFTITFYDSGSTAVVRTFDYYVKGFGRKALTFI